MSRPVGRPRVADHLKRVPFTTTLAPNTKEDIHREAERLGISCGDMLSIAMKAHFKKSMMENREEMFG